MKLDDVSWQDWTNPDASFWFERTWRELDAREDAFEETAELVYHNLELACDGSLVDIGAVTLLGIRESGGVELIAFVCPRCYRHHESRLIG